MAKWIDEFRRGWQGTSQPSPLLSIGFAVFCLALATLARWGMALLRPDIFFTPYFPAMFFAAAFGGLWAGIATALAGSALGLILNFSHIPVNSARLALMAIFLAVCAMTLWGIEHYRSIAARQRGIARRLIEEEAYRKLVVDELQHRLKNKLSTVHAVLHQVLHDQPQVWNAIDGRLRALSATDDLIAKVDGRGCDIKDLLLSELGPYDHVRFTLNGEPLFLPAKLAVSLALIFHELATNAEQIWRIRFATRTAPGVMVDVGRPSLHRLGRDRRPRGGTGRTTRIRHQASEFRAASVRRQDRDFLPQDRHSLRDELPRPRGRCTVAGAKRNA